MQKQLHNLDERLLVANLVNKNNEEDYNILMQMYYAIADISLKASNFGAFQLKLQWFINAIQSNQPTFNPVVDSYLKLCEKYDLNSLDFIKILEQKNIDLDNIMFDSQESLINYAKNTGGILMKNLTILTQSNVNLDVAIKVGELFAIVGLIFNYYYFASKSCFALLYRAEQVEDSSKKYLINNVKSLVKYVQEQLNMLSKQKKIFNKSTKKLLLLNIFTKSYLKSIEKQGYDVTKIKKIQINFINYLELIINFFINH